MAEDVFGVFGETGADVVTRYVVVEPVLAFVKARLPELYLDGAYYALKKPHELTFIVAGVNTVLDVATNQIPIVRKSGMIRKVKKEILGQLPRALIAHYNQHQNDFNLEGHKPTFISQDQVVGAMRKAATENIVELGKNFVGAVTELPHKIHDRIFGKGEKVSYEFIRELHFEMLTLLKKSERKEWGTWVTGLDDRGQEVLRESLPGLASIEAIRVVLAQETDNRIKFLQAYAKEGPLEDFYQGVGAALNPHLDAANRALRRELRKFR